MVLYYICFNQVMSCYHLVRLYKTEKFVIYEYVQIDIRYTIIYHIERYLSMQT